MMVFRTVTSHEGYFLPCLLDEGLRIRLGFEPMGPSIILVPTPASGVPIRASVLPSPKLVRNEGGTPTPVAAKNQQPKFRLQRSFGCKDGSENVTPVPPATE